MTQESREQLTAGSGNIIGGIMLLGYIIGGIFGIGTMLICILPILWLKVFIIEEPVLLTGIGILVFF